VIGLEDCELKLPYLEKHFVVLALLDVVINLISQVGDFVADDIWHRVC